MHTGSYQVVQICIERRYQGYVRFRCRHELHVNYIELSACTHHPSGIPVDDFHSNLKMSYFITAILLLQFCQPRYGDSIPTINDLLVGLMYSSVQKGDGRNMVY